ncbi:unnamed protein product [Caenorhabditis brenneri]
MGDNGVELPPVAPSNTNTPVEQLQCTICLSAEFAQECRIFGCNHAFCFICIAEWVCQSLRPSCPMCRQNVDKISYDFTEQQTGRKEIVIKEFRSGHMTLTPSDRNQLLGERRVVVRNLMHSYKVAGLLSSEITSIDDSKEPNDILKEAIEELIKIITQHIQNAELSLVDLRTDIARKNKSVVFKSLTFRRMIYSRKIKLKYLDQKRQKLKPEDISKEPERFRGVITDFLISEFDAIPHQNQPELAGQKWRTKFLGGSISLDEKQRYAAQIYDLMLVTPTGSEAFQKEMNDILTVVSNTHIKLLDDHLEAIVAIEKTKIEEFYNEVYYDSVYNSFSQNFFDYNAMINVRDDPQGRFEAIFSQIHREMNPADWVNPYTRFMAARAENRVPNGGETSSDSSDEERVATPMPDGAAHGHRNIARVYFEELLELPDTDTGTERAQELVRRYEQVHALRRNNRQNEGSTPTGQTTRTLPRSEQSDSSRTHMTLRSSARREREAAQGQALAQAGPPHPDDLVRRLIGFNDNSDEIVELLRPGPPRTGTTSSLFAAAPPPATVEVIIRPRTVYEVRSVHRRGQGGNERTTDPPAEESQRSGRRYMAYFRHDPLPGFVDPFAGTPFAMNTTQRTERRVEPPVQPAAAVSTQENVNPPEPDSEVTSIARRTRAARRADLEGRSGPPSGAPPPKRSSINRRDSR